MNYQGSINSNFINNNNDNLLCIASSTTRVEDSRSSISQVQTLLDNEIEKLLDRIPQRGIKICTQILILLREEVESMKKLIASCSKHA